MEMMTALILIGVFALLFLAASILAVLAWVGMECREETARILKKELLRSQNKCESLLCQLDKHNLEVKKIWRDSYDIHSK